MFTRNLLRTLPRYLLAAALAAGVATTGLYAVDGNPPGLFELDGNTVDVAGGGDDWGSLFSGDQLGSPAAFTGILADPAPLTIFTQGGSKDINDVTEWRYTDGSVPDKDDITNAYAAAYTVPAGAGDSLNDEGDLIIYFGLDRFANNGDAFAGFWFFQDAVGLGPNKQFIGEHVEGDLLVLVEYPQGANAVPEIKVYQWVTSGGDVSENLQHVFTTSAQCDGAGDKLACAITNHDNLGGEPVWPYTPKNGFAGIPFESFYEGGINVSKLIGGDVPCFSSFLAETRSSRSETAQLKDFVLGDFDLCAISVTKECVAEVDGSDGGNSILVDFNGVVTNDGGLDLHDVTVTDDMGTPGDTGDDVVVFGPADLAAGESQPYTGSYSTTAIPAEDTVTAEGHRNGTSVTATADASCSPDIEPALTVDKVCTANVNEAGTGVDVLFSGTVTNSGNVALEGVTVVDDQGTADPGDDVTVLGPVTLDVGESMPYDGGFSALGGASSTDNVTASGADVLSGSPVEATAQATCEADVLPALEVSKVCSATVDDEGTGIDVLFDGLVTNTGNVVLENVTVVDDAGTPGVPGDDAIVLGPISLAPGESVPYNGGFAVSGTNSSTDSVTASGSDILTQTPVDASAQATCEAEVLPDIEVSKVCSATVNAGGTGIDVLFDGLVTNTGNVVLENVTVVDDAGTPGVPGDDAIVLGPISLAPGESVPYNGGFAVSGTNSSTDSVTASGSDILTQTPVDASAQATCEAEVLPDIEVSKVCSATVNAGGTGIDVLFDGLVTNTGNVVLENVTVVDDSGTPGVPGDDAVVLGPISLAPGESVPYNGGFGVSGTNSSTDNVTASGTDVLTQASVDASALATCSAPVLPSIDVSKVCSANINAGGTGIDVLFDGLVTNTGNVILENVMVVDDAGTPGVPGDDAVVLGPISLAPGDSVPYNGGFGASGVSSTDVVTASATDALTQTPVDASAQATCTADVLATIAVDKVCTASINTGGIGIDVLFSGTVSNTGNVALENVIVVDDSGTPAIPGDDVTVLGPITLAPGASAPYSGSFAASGSSSTDSVSVSANDVVSGSPVAASAQASCNAQVLPSLDVTKQCTDAPAFGEAILFDGTVTNTGNVALLNVVVLDDNGTPGDTSDDVPFNLGNLAPGASANYNGSYSPSVAGFHTNTVVASASDAVESSPVSATANATCEVPPPPDFEGCTPGFWKNSTGSWAPTGYSPNQLVGSVFSLPSGVLNNQLADDSLLEALGYPGGTNLLGAAQILLRAAVASLLNAAHPDVEFPWTEAEIIGEVNAALASKDRGTILALASELDAENNLGCDLPNDNSF